MSDLLVPPLAVDSRSQAIDALAARITGLDLTPILVYLIDLVPSDALPFLAEQFNVVGPLWAYLKDETAKRRAIKESVAWHRAKGTPWSVETALSWAGHVAKVEDTTGSANRWAEYQLELGAPVAGDALQAVLELSRFAAPARSHLVRLYGGYDRRPIRFDYGPPLDDGWLDDDSGIDVGDLKLSFGQTLKTQAEPAAQAPRGIGLSIDVPIRCLYIDRPLLDHWRLDDKLPESPGIVAGELVSFVGQPLRGGGSIATRFEVSRSQLVLDEAPDGLDDILSCLDRRTAIVIDNPMRLDDSCLDSHDIGCREIPLDILSIQQHAFGTPALTPGQPAFGGADIAVALHGAGLHGERRWTGRWDSRRWYPYIAYINFTEDTL